MWKTWVQSLGWEDPLKKGMGTHSSVLAWRILMAEEPGGLQSMRLQRVRHDWTTNTHTHIPGLKHAKSWLWLEPTVFQLWSHTSSQDLTKLRFLMSHLRKNSGRDKVIGKKWKKSDRNTLLRQSVGHLRRWEWTRNVVWVFLWAWVMSQANEWKYT